VVYLTSASVCLSLNSFFFQLWYTGYLTLTLEMLAFRFAVNEGLSNVVRMQWITYPQLNWLWSDLERLPSVRSE